MLEKNMNLLKIHFPMLWNRLKEMEKTLHPKRIKAITTDHVANIYIKNGKKKLYFHDTIDPIDEAEKIIDQHTDAEEYSDVLFYGIGLGYHINAFIKRHPGIVFSIYEPVPEVFFQYLTHVDLSQFPLSSIKYLFIEDQAEYAGRIAYEFVGQMRDSVKVIDFPAYKKLFPGSYENFFTHFEDAINERRSAVNTTLSFQKIWTLNSMLNLDKVLSTPNLLLEAADKYKNQPAVLIGAGPSLDDEIDHLRYISENGLAYIFSAGAAINTLIDHDIYPHAACTYDPSEKNQMVFQKLIDRGITNIPLIFGSSVGFATLEKYPGPKLHILTSPDKISHRYLRSRSGLKLEYINDAPSISAITLQLLIKLGFNPIILVGMNLGYQENRQHAKGLDYSQASISDHQLAMAVEAEDVHGNTVKTNPSYNRMRAQMEMYAAMYPEIAIINTTQRGAKIKGTSFKPLAEVIGEVIPKRVFNEHWLDMESSIYDIDYLIKQVNMMASSRDKTDQLIHSFKDLLNKIDKQAERRKFRNMAHMYAALEVVLSNLRQNEFFSTFILPMNQLENEVFQRAILNINRENDHYKQAKKTVSEYEEFIYSCENDIQMITPSFEKMTLSIERFIRNNIREKAKKIKFLFMRFEGTISNKLECSSRGNLGVNVTGRDMMGIHRLQQHSIPCAVFSSSSSKSIENACRHLGIQHLFLGVKGSKQAIEAICAEHGITRQEIAWVIDDRADLAEAEQEFGLTFAVQDAMDEVKQKTDYVLRQKGGEGVIREIAEVLLSADFPIRGTVIGPR